MKLKRVLSACTIALLAAGNTQEEISVDADLWGGPEALGVSWPIAMAELDGSLHDNERFTSTFRLEDGGQHGTLSVAASQEKQVDSVLAFDTYAVTESRAVPVPEPATSILLLGGWTVLALAGQLRRRRGVGAV